VLNLVSNAARYTDAGEISVEVVRMGQSVVANVRDTGPGIHETELQKIFEPFHQGANGMWRDRSGAGLGLAISRQFIELHGGHIWVESVLGQGSAFSFRLPIVPTSLPLSSAGRWLNEEWVWVARNDRPELPPAELRRRVILFDETGELFPLFSRSYEEIEFVDTRTLEEVERALDECPAHVIILNTDVPEKLWPLLDEARSAITDTPIIGYSMPPRLERAVQRGVVKYLVKPVTRADLRTLLPPPNGKPHRILVADDDDDFRQLLARMLQSLDASITVEPARSGSEALEMMRLDPPDMVLLDVSMPDLDGWQVLAHKNQDESIRDIPVTIVSAQDPYDFPAASGVMVGAGKS
jgi:CheY-like chemotaxis protein